MPRDERLCCESSTGNYVRLDDISKSVADKLTGRAVEEKVHQESQIFSRNRLSKRYHE